jgi:hypothetical protein
MDKYRKLPSIVGKLYLFFLEEKYVITSNLIDFIKIFLPEMSQIDANTCNSFTWLHYNIWLFFNSQKPQLQRKFKEHYAA